MTTQSTQHSFSLAEHHLGSRSGFSLVEVTIALAIAGLGFTTLLGVLPQGMDMVRRTSELTVGSKVIQKLTGELQSASWSNVNWTGYGTRRYFTDEGVEIPATEVQNPANPYGLLTYVTSVYVEDQKPEVLLPAGTAEPYLRRVRICVATTNNPSFSFESAASFRFLSIPVVLAKVSEQ